jgi:endonuclease YncB( thermonuclease family)
MLNKYFFILAGFLLLAYPAFAEQFNAACEKVVDADTLLVTANGKQSTVHLAYIVAPEPQQKFGAEAKQFLESLAVNQKLRIHIISSKEDQITAEVFSPKKQDSINQELIRKGLAWPVLENNTKHPYDLTVSFAKKHLLGVWSDPQLKPPDQKSNSKVKKAARSAGAAEEKSQAPSSETQGGNFLMRQRQNINSKATAREAQQPNE